MSFSVGSALFAYLVTVACSFIVAKRSVNWRIRLLALTFTLLPLCQIVVLLAKEHIWIEQEVGQIAESLELLAGALCLTSVHLLSKENTNRKNTDSRLRVAEEALPLAGTFRSGHKKAATPST
jgi:hypothetical protein